jgi:hypothetical protein
MLCASERQAIKMLKKSFLQIVLLGALLSPMAQASPTGPVDCGGGGAHTVDAPRIIFSELLQDNESDPPRYRDGYYQDAKKDQSTVVVRKPRWRVYAVDREEPKSTTEQIQQTIKDWLKDKALSALQKVADSIPLTRIIKNADKTADALASGDFRRGVWVTYIREGSNGEVLESKVERLSGDDELPWQIKGGDEAGQQKVLKSHLTALNRAADAGK